MIQINDERFLPGIKQIRMAGSRAIPEAAWIGTKTSLDPDSTS